MNYYQEITLLPDSTIPLDFLWQKVYQQIHIALVDNKTERGDSNVAVAFPEYGSPGFRLGKKLRVIAQDTAMLEQLNLTNWLAKLSDYVHVKSIQAVPSNARPVSYLRQQVKGAARIESDMQKKAALWAKKSGRTLGECLADLEKSRPTKRSLLPFIWVESLHGKSEKRGSRPFPLFIQCVEAEHVIEGRFNCYGLSQVVERNKILTTVPHF
ncbi:type I-F CRISPR-associated endoribonuclease Cas6/Csy4 [Providencia alcalifaciens]|uniref:type I-F CRISPR-associated endoribonuclease Cas6/Csy4 n=1 Tax=Providencia alcalifaciens TaxID=126385 RepID=UPI000D96EC3B|nr:type I-F CRISPR-associated endoribonuclease Cas6/Csy4 [Providencia alcalifaciens]MTC27784.1 type I-F CRISPR-associated endoribonuclease Cas6/Csy4 [Providencia alcalifaciens]SPY69029.1 CRISPR-associated protein Cas6/Csy4, subtype I-F/YPEST [Providencia alcalifaciens]